MRKLIMNLAVSLDGFIEGPNGEYDWCFTDQDYGLTDFFESVDTIFMGRNSYDLLANSGDLAQLMHNKIYVFSDTVTEAAFGDIEVIGSKNFVEKVKKVKDEEGKDIWIFGGARLLHSLMPHRLIDEFVLSMHPVILGGGTPLFNSVTERTDLELLSATPFATGLVQLRYRLMPKFNEADLDALDFQMN